VQQSGAPVRSAGRGTVIGELFIQEVEYFVTVILLHFRMMCLLYAVCVCVCVCVEYYT
jgi:hypothetical protein